MLNSNIININETQRLAKVLEAEFYTEMKGKGKKKSKPMNLTFMVTELHSVKSNLSNSDTTTLKTRDTLLKRLSEF